MTEFDDGAEDLFDAWPEMVLATFAPPSGDPVLNVPIVIEKSIRNLPNGYDAQVWGDVVQIEYILAAAGHETVQGETITVGDAVYTVVDVIENDGRFVRVLAR